MIKAHNQTIIALKATIMMLVICASAAAQSCDNPTSLCGFEDEEIQEFSSGSFAGSDIDFCFDGDMWSVARFHTTNRVTDEPVIVTIDNLDCAGGPVKAMVVEPDFSDFCDVSQYQVRSDCVTLSPSDSTRFATYNGLYANTDYLVLVNYNSATNTGPCEMDIIVRGQALSIDIFPDGYNYDETPPNSYQVDYGYDVVLTVQGGDNGLGYTWTPGDQISGPSSGSTINATPGQTTTYTVEGFVESCNYSTQVTYNVGYPLNIPNSFSPNGDETNDTWDVTGLNNYPGSIINLYDRWGQQVIRKSGDFSWDGTSEKTGKDSPIGAYYYVITLNHQATTLEPLTGYITLVR